MAPTASSVRSSIDQAKSGCVPGIDLDNIVDQKHLDHMQYIDRLVGMFRQQHGT